LDIANEILFGGFVDQPDGFSLFLPSTPGKAAKPVPDFFNRRFLIS